MRGNSCPDTGSLQSLMRRMRSHNPKYTNRHTYPKEKNTGKLKTPHQHYLHLSQGVEHLPSLINWKVTHISAAFDGPTPTLFCFSEACLHTTLHMRVSVIVYMFYPASHRFIPVLQLCRKDSTHI